VILKDLRIYVGKQGKYILKNLKILKLLVLSLMRSCHLFLVNCNQLESCKGFTLKIYCERCWLILEDIKTIFLKKMTCGYADAVVISVSVMMLVLHM